MFRDDTQADRNVGSLIDLLKNAQAKVYEQERELKAFEGYHPDVLRQDRAALLWLFQDVPAEEFAMNAVLELLVLAKGLPELDECVIPALVDSLGLTPEDAEVVRARMYTMAKKRKNREDRVSEQLYCSNLNYVSVYDLTYPVMYVCMWLAYRFPYPVEPRWPLETR